MFFTKQLNNGSHKMMYRFNNGNDTFFDCEMYVELGLENIKDFRQLLKNLGGTQDADSSYVLFETDDIAYQAKEHLNQIMKLRGD